MPETVGEHGAGQLSVCRRGDDAGQLCGLFPRDAHRGYERDGGTWTAWVIAVAFGYVANKIFVFKTHCESTAALLREAGSFFTMRLVSLGMETVLMFLLVEMLHLNDLAMKLLVNIVVIILNYVFSKLFIFKKK